MQLPSHILVGAFIQKGFADLRPRPLALGLTAVCAFLSHGVLDKLANLTYHLANPDFHSPVWVGYHAALVVVTGLFLYWWWKPYKWGVFFACVPDVDWVFIHGQEIFHFRIGFYRQPRMHHFLGWIIDNFPPLAWLNRLPNFRHHPWAILPEVVLIVVLVVLLRVRSQPRGKAVAAS